MTVIMKHSKFLEQKLAIVYEDVTVALAYDEPDAVASFNEEISLS